MGDPPNNPVLIWLHGIDVALLVGGAALVIAGATYCALRRKNPLRPRPERLNSLTPELLLVPLVVLALASTFTLPLVGGLTGDAESDAAALAAGNLTQAVAGVSCIVIGAWTFHGGLRRFALGEGRPARDVAVALLAIVAALPVCTVVLYLTGLLFAAIAPSYEFNQHHVIDILRRTDQPPWTMPVLWFGTVLIAPIAEECFFRGLVQTALVKWTHRTWPAVLIAALFFGIAHADQKHVVATLAVLGAILGLVYERTGSLLAPIVMHMLFNLKTLLWEALSG